MERRSRYLQSEIAFLKGVGPKKAEVLNKDLRIFTFGDFLNHFPYRYIDRSRFHKVMEVNTDEQYFQVKGKFIRMETVGPPRRQRLEASFMDDTGTLKVVWFKGIKWIQESIKPGVEYVLFGKPSRFQRDFNLVHPEIEVPGQQKFERQGLQPLYNTTEPMKKHGLDSKGMERLMRQLMAGLQATDLPEIFPEDTLKYFKLMPRHQAIISVHYPPDLRQAQTARNRIKFEEFFFEQIKMLKIRNYRAIAYKGFIFENLGKQFHSFYEDKLPFELTGAQKRVLKEIRKDTLSGKQMNRLLQGDVGSGKTVVSLMTMLMAVDNGFQACMMAPTEILAQQHYQGISELLKDLPIHVAMLTGSVKGKERKNILTALKEGALDIIIGTHALLEDKVVFKNIGLAVIDEQHRFGVAQRAKLWKKNTQPPHVLVMTATPIPRTLAMTVYGDLDVSIIDELPPGRKPIQTNHRFDKDRLKVFGFMKDQIALGRQIYVVYPLIEESAKLDLKDLMDGYESISRAFPLPQYRISIVHGKMKPEDKDREMQVFARGDSQIMVATTVIEVGVNVPNASVMVIENAERFGLSQLHQLRGRVGRGADQSYCILMSGYKLSKEARQRLSIMCETNDGFRIAEEDLALRGPGDIEGTQQSGMANFKLASITADKDILQASRMAAEKIIDADPDLEEPQNQKLLAYLEKNQKIKTGWSRIS
jgi:ATP-dependent DNA helicase RecG